MAAPVKAVRALRIVSLPLTRPTRNAALQPSAQLTFYHFHLTTPRPPPPSSTDSKGKSRWIPEEGIIKWGSSKAASVWAGFGKADEGNWKYKIYQYGERLQDRLDFEELALKTIDPSLGPVYVEPKDAGKEDPPTIPLLYPPSIYSGQESIQRLRDLLEYRLPRHRKGYIRWLIISPFTAPFAIIPIIPNLPFFFCIWRAWSHYRAYKASQYLEMHLIHDHIVPEPSQELDVIYRDLAPKEIKPPSPTSSTDTKPDTSEKEASSTSKPPPGHYVLLTRDAIPAIVSLFNLKEAAGADMYRAVEQARLRVKSGREKL